MVIYMASKIPLAGVKLPAIFCILSKSEINARQTGINTIILRINEAAIIIKSMSFRGKYL